MASAPLPASDKRGHTPVPPRYSTKKRPSADIDGRDMHYLLGPLPFSASFSIHK